jgi:hypothetical protein
VVLKEIKEFIVSQIKGSDWTSESFTDVTKYNSKYITIKIHRTTTDNSVIFNIKAGVKSSITGIHLSSDFNITRKELGLNLIHFWILIGYIKRSSKNAEKRKREKEISYQWNEFLKNNKDLRRDNKLDKILK